MKIYSIPQNKKFQPKLAQNPVVKNSLKLAKEVNETTGKNLLGGLLDNGTKIVRETQDVFVKTITDIEKEAQIILENHPKKNEILNIIRESNEELKITKL